MALVTGAAQGIGKVSAIRLRDEGYSVFGVDFDSEAISAAERDERSAGVRFLQGDVGSEADAEAICRRIGNQFAGLDLLVNNAGISAMGVSAENLSLEGWNRVLATNLTGAFLFAKHAARLLRARRGAIVNIASTRALMSEPNSEAYAASKGGLVALTHALAISLGPEVRVNSISPGWIEVTPWKAGATGGVELSERDHAQHPCGRVGRPEDIASLVVFLADPANGFITGENIVADGGMTRKMIYG